MVCKYLPNRKPHAILQWKDDQDSKMFWSMWLKVFKRFNMIQPWVLLDSGDVDGCALGDILGAIYA